MASARTPFRKSVAPLICRLSLFLKFVAIEYDHNIFPGAVPRTFIGSVLLAWVSAPVIKIAATLDLVDSKADLQIIGECWTMFRSLTVSHRSLQLAVRLVLATINAIGLILIRRAVSRWFGRLTGFLWALLTCTQPYLLFWMGRTLPNMFALFPGACVDPP